MKNQEKENILALSITIKFTPDASANKSTDEKIDKLGL
jgi:hypothetical protein